MRCKNKVHPVPEPDLTSDLISARIGPSSPNDQPVVGALTKELKMSKVTVNRRGPAGKAGRVTLSHLRAGETFRFPRSASGTVYQLLSVSARSLEEGTLDEVDSFMFANVATGQVYATEDSRAVVPVDCSLTVRDRVATTTVSRAKKSAASGRVTATRARNVVKTKSQSRR